MSLHQCHHRLKQNRFLNLLILQRHRHLLKEMVMLLYQNHQHSLVQMCHYLLMNLQFLVMLHHRLSRLKHLLHLMKNYLSHRYRQRPADPQNSRHRRQSD